MQSDESEGSSIANAALLKATLAFDRIERHEAECSRRWGMVRNMMFFVMVQMTGLVTFLIADKLNWL